MQFSDTTNDEGIVQEARWLVHANTTTFPTNDITRSVNRWFDSAVAIIFEADGRWQWDDSNEASEAIYTDDLVSGTGSYSVLSSHLRVTRVEVLDADAKAIRMVAIDQNDVSDTLTDFLSTDGTPEFYDLIGNDIKLYPAPNYAETDGLRIYFQRAGSYFSNTDTTKTPGFSPLFHRYLSLGAALDYATRNNLETRNRFKEELVEMEGKMQHFYNHRMKDENIILKVKQANFR